MIKARSNYKQEVLDQGVIARGSMKQCFYIYDRTLQGTTLDSPLPAFAFELLFTIMGQTVPVSPQAVFDGVNIDDRPSHIGWVTYDPTIEALGTNSCFVKVEYWDAPDRYYKLNTQENYMSQSRFLRLFLRETSLDALIPASEM